MEEKMNKLAEKQWYIATTYSGHEQKAADPLAGLCVRFKYLNTLFFKKSAPLCGYIRVCKVGAVEYDKSRLSGGETVDIRVPAGVGYARIKDLAHGIDLLYAVLYHALCLGHVAGKPLDIHFFVIYTVHIIHRRELRWSQAGTRAAKPYRL